MGTAAVSAFEEGRASPHWDTLRPQRPERGAPWRATLETQWHEPPAPGAAMPATGWHVRPPLPGGLPETLVAPGQRGAPDRPPVPGPRWHGVVRAQACVCRTVATMGGPVPRERPSCYWRRCRVGGYPCDDAVGMVAGGQQRALHQAVVPLGTAGP